MSRRVSCLSQDSTEIQILWDVLPVSRNASLGQHCLGTANSFVTLKCYQGALSQQPNTSIPPSTVG